MELNRNDSEYYFIENSEESAEAHSEVHDLQEQNQELKVKNSQLQILVDQLFSSADLETKQAEQQALMNKISALERQIQEQRLEYEAQISELGSDCWNFENQHLALKREDAQAKESIAKLETTISEMQTQLQAVQELLDSKNQEVESLKECLREQEEKHSLQLVSWQQNIEEHEAKTQALVSQLHVNADHREELKLKVEHLEKALKAQISDSVALSESIRQAESSHEENLKTLASLRAKLKILESDNSCQNEELNTERSKIRTLETQLKAAEANLANRNQELDSLRALQKETTQRLSDGQAEMNHLQSKIESMDAKINEQKEEIAFERSRNRFLEARCKTQETSLTEKTEELESLTSTHQESSEQLINSQKSVLKLQNELSSSRIENEAFKDNLQQVESFYKAQIEHLQQCQLNSEGEKKELRTQLKDLRERNQQYARQVEESEVKCATLTRAMNDRDQQLQSYVGTVNRERSQIVGIAKRLVEEIQSAATLHPLKDYLSITEQEIMKLENQIIQTPTISIDRRRLEICLNQMREQKRTLMTMIETSTADLQRRATWLKKVIGNDVTGGQMPPPPPRAGAAASKPSDKMDSKSAYKIEKENQI